MERIGEYLVGRLIGEGGMGKVFEAQERLSKRPVALKVLRPELARSEEGRRLFLNEMTILAHLDHPNVVRCLACTEVDGELVMALELLEGKNLREVLIERGRLPWPEAVGIACQIAAALGAAHGQDPPIIHRDLKPENVILLPDGHVKVMDFGIAKVLEALSRTTTHSIGTLQYMSPEQIDAAGVDARSDLYGLGLVLYELLAGHPPFESASPRELLNLQCTAEPTPLPDAVRSGLPKGVERLVFALLSKRPDHRPEHAQAVLTALEPFGSADGAARSSTSTVRATTPRSPSGFVTVPPVGATQPAGIAVATARRPSPVSDTIGLVERASAPRQIRTPVALAIVVVLSLLAGSITYAVKAAFSGSSDATPATERTGAAP
jgi:serine/threonine-protein kinase